MIDRLRAPKLARAARSASKGDSEVAASIMATAALSYGARPQGDVTTPTGFDPSAAALFEALVEVAYLIARADGRFDDEERRTFEGVVVATCGGAVATKEITDLIDELDRRLRTDGLDRRVESLAGCVLKEDHAREILRVGALVARASEGVSAVERDLLVKVAARCGLTSSDVEAALAQASSAMEIP